MGAGLLQSLVKYPPTANQTPLENFITEAFAWMLREHPDFSRHFLSFIVSRLDVDLFDYVYGDVHWLTQYNLNGVYPDMVCLLEKKNASGRLAVIFEHKGWGEPHEGQIESYREKAVQRFEKSKIVLITATPRQHVQDVDLALCWSDIYKLIDRWLGEHADASFIFRDFQGLLKSQGLGPPAPISHESIKYYYATVGLKNNIKDLVRRVKESKDWSSYIEEGCVLWTDRNRDGRLGIDVFGGSWKPGLFVGILLDGGDHRTRPLDIYKGPDFCLIVDFDKSLHDDYPRSPNYVSMVSSLVEKVRVLGDGWQFYNHLEDSSVSRKNKWHPIHIRKPMLDVFGRSSTAEEQTDIFYDTAIMLIELVARDKYFLRLRSEYGQDLRIPGGGPGSNP